MLGCRTAIGVGSCALALATAFGCGGSTSHNPEGDEPFSTAGQSSTAGRGSSAGGGNSSRAGSAGAGGSGTPQSGGAGMDPPPIDTECKPEDLPPPSIECDPFGPNTCGDGRGCYPFVDHPEGGGCDAQVYGTICLSAGLGFQGALCGDQSSDGCAAGHVCVVGQRAGKRCAKLCELGVPGQCSNGLICGDLDVAGYGVCG
jgi:hypothetical protein